jgi:hypothetical protein
MREENQSFRSLLEAFHTLTSAKDGRLASAVTRPPASRSATSLFHHPLLTTDHLTTSLDYGGELNINKHECIEVSGRVKPCNQGIP